MNIEPSTDVFTVVHEIMVRSFELDPAAVIPEAELANDLDLDSIDAVDMMVEIQALVGTTIPEDSFQHLRTIADVVTLLEGMLKEKEANSGNG